MMQVKNVENPNLRAMAERINRNMRREKRARHLEALGSCKARELTNWQWIIALGY